MPGSLGETVSPASGWQAPRDSWHPVGFVHHYGVNLFAARSGFPRARGPLRHLLCALVPAAIAAVSVQAAPPGTIIDHRPAASGIYIGSPALAVLTNGWYVASHDEFGPRSTEHTQAVTTVFVSRDRGGTWTNVSRVEGQFWSSLFVHRGALYLLGTDKHHGNVVIRRSVDEGRTWTSPTNAATGLLRDEGQYHCAPVPVIEHDGRLWRAMERRDPPTGWGITYTAGMLSAPAEADLLQASSWVNSNFLRGYTNWLGGTFNGWLEGNAVVDPGGQVVNVLRVDLNRPAQEKAAVVIFGGQGRMAYFSAHGGFIDFPGGAKKFVIRRDPVTQLYWSLATVVLDQHRESGRPAGIRNTLALTSSPDLRSWTVRCVLLYHPDVAKHGFQYVDWLFDGADLIAVCRTAWDDGHGGAHNNHDANYLTFHRIVDFRHKTGKDSAPLTPAPAGKAP